MTILRHELRQSKLSLIIWTAVICFLLTVSILLFPEMEKEMEERWEAIRLSDEKIKEAETRLANF